MAGGSVSTTTQSAAQTESSNDSKASSSSESSSATAADSSAGTLAPLEEVKVEVTKEGTGKACKDGDIATVNYTGKLYQNQGVVFDSSIPRGEPFEFSVGGYTVIKCWQTAVMQMKSGEEANVYCPSKTAYGKQAQGKIPANSDLLFEISVKQCKDMFA